MVNPSLDDTEEKPLDPAVLRVQARLRRLMLISGLTLGIGIAAVLAGVVYRITRPDDTPPLAADVQHAAAAVIPAGARLVSSSLAGDRIVLTYEHAGGTTLVVVDAKSLAVIGRLELTPRSR